MTTPTADLGQRFLLERPPIELAIFEARFPAQISQVTMDQGLRIRDVIADAVGAAFPSVEPAQAHEVTLTLDPDGSARQRTSSALGMQVLDPGSSVAIGVFPGQLAIQAQAYVRWSVTFRPLVDAALAALDQVLAPTIVARLGLRYINRFRNPGAGDPRFWAQRIDPSLAGPIVEGPFAKQVTRVQHQVELRLDGGVGATLRHGVIPEPTPWGTYSYLLDLDVYMARTEPFEAHAILNTAELLNRQAAQVFRKAMRPMLADELGAHDIAAGDAAQ